MRPAFRRMHVTTHYMPTLDSYDRERKRKQSIIYAIRRGFFSHVRYLLENTQANPNEIYQVNENSVQISPTALIPLITYHSNYQGNNVPMVNNISQLVNSVYSCNGRTPLMFCASIDDDVWAYGIAQNLIEKGAKVGQKDPHGLNALMYACIHQKKNLVRLYVNAPGDYNLLSVDNFGNTAMHIAGLGRMQTICKILCDTCIKYDINPLTDIPKNKFGHTPFDLCVANGHKSCMEYANTISEYFSNKKANKSTNRIFTAYRRDERINKAHNSLNSTSFSALGDYYTNSKISSIYTNNTLNPTYTCQVNCPSILFENSETNMSTTSSSPLNQKLVNNVENQDNQTNIPTIQVTSASRSLQIQNQPAPIAAPTTTTTTTTATTSTTTSATASNSNMGHLPSFTASNLVFGSVLEIYKSIYPYKEPAIKVNVNETNKPNKNANNQVKPNKFELRPLHTAKSKNKVKIDDTKKESKRLLKSALVVIDKSDNLKKLNEEENFVKSQIIDSSSNLKSVSFSNIYTILDNNIINEMRSPRLNNVEPPKEQFVQETLTQLQTLPTWRNQVNKLYDSLESQNTDSYRRGFQYTATSFDNLVGFQTTNSLYNNMNGPNRRSSVNRRSLTSTTTGNFLNAGRKQSTVNSLLINMKMNSTNIPRRPSVTSNA